MVKFSTVVPLPVAELLSGRVVCDVTEYRTSHPLVGQIVAWRGSVEAEYFSITFMKGILTLSLAEREMLIGQNAVNYAVVSVLGEAMARGDSIASAEATFNYHLKQGEKDTKEISFTDVMVALGWRYKEGAKIHYDMLMD